MFYSSSMVVLTQMFSVPSAAMILAMTSIFPFKNGSMIAGISPMSMASPEPNQNCQSVTLKFSKNFEPYFCILPVFLGC